MSNTLNWILNKTNNPNIFVDFTKKQQILLNTDIDILALSCTWHRLRQTDISQHIESLSDTNLYTYVVTSDIAKASKMREYYSKKLMLISLKGNKLTEFRKSLAEVLENNGQTTDEKLRGIVYRLPEFYDYDRSLDELYGTVFNNENYEEFPLKPITLELQPVQKLNRKTRQANVNNYFFKTVNNSNAACIGLSVNHQKPLLKIWDQIFSRGQTLKIKGVYALSNKKDYPVYIVNNWELDNNIHI